MKGTKTSLVPDSKETSLNPINITISSRPPPRGHKVFIVSGMFAFTVAPTVTGILYIEHVIKSDRENIIPIKSS